MCLCWRMILSLHRQGFSLGCCSSSSGSGCAVLTGYLPSYTGVTFTALQCGSCFTFHKYLKIHCTGELKLELLPSDTRCGNSCLESGSFVCSHWLLGRMIFPFPLQCTGFLWMLYIPILPLKYTPFRSHSKFWLCLCFFWGDEGTHYSLFLMRRWGNSLPVSKLELATQVPYASQAGWIVERVAQLQFAAVAVYFTPCTVSLLNCCLQREQECPWKKADTRMPGERRSSCNTNRLPTH